MEPAASMLSANRRRAASEALELQLRRRTLETMLEQCGYRDDVQECEDGNLG